MGKEAIVIGAGIVGLAISRALSLRGYKVTVLEKNDRAVGASVRNFGMIWPIGQPEGKLYQRALRSKEIWEQIAGEEVFALDKCGSLHLAYHADEWTVLNELKTSFSSHGRQVSLLSVSDIQKQYHGINQENLLGGLFSASEVIVDPREAMYVLPAYLTAKHKVTFEWNQPVVEVQNGKVRTVNETYEADLVFVCQGYEIDSLYPDVYRREKMTKCKLQMLRFLSEDPAFRIGTAVCGGLSLIHYDSFKVAPSLSKLKQRFTDELSAYLSLGIHVMVSQNAKGELTVGDSHEYGNTFSPFDDNSINTRILEYLKTFVHCDNWELVQSWHGIYTKLTNGHNGACSKISDSVYVVNGMGGAGMTLSFGYAEEIATDF